MSRLENLLGAYALTVADRLVAAGAAAGIAPSEQAALVTLAAHPDRPVAWLGDVLGLTSSGATRLVDRLTRAGWVTRSTGADSRERRLRLTASGRGRVRVALRAREEMLSRSVAGLTDDERAELEQVLGRMVAGLASSRLPALQTCRLCDRGACESGERRCPLEQPIGSGDPHA